jgi:hypothetical protein
MLTGGSYESLCLEKRNVGHLLNASFLINLVRNPRYYFLRRTIILGTSIFVVSVIAGIAMTFWREYGTDLPKMPESIDHRLLLQATAGPIYIALAFLLPITLPVMFVLAIIAYIGSRLKGIWLSLAAFLLMGLYWLWMVKLISDGAFD